MATIESRVADRYQLFPDESDGRRGLTHTTVDFTLTYAGKEPDSEILRRRAASEFERTMVVGDSHAANRIYFGENSDALRTLVNDPTVHGRVTLVYIDPPYGTEQAFRGRSSNRAYEDNLSGASYLEFIRERIILLRELLADDGSIYVHLDNAMAAPIKIIMDEIFGPRNFRNWITRKKCNPKNFTNRQFGNMQDYILFYSKGKNPVWNRPFEEERIYSLEQRFPRVEMETGRRYALVPLHAKGRRSGPIGGPWRGVLPPEGKHWQYHPDKLDELDRQGQIYWSSTGNPRRKIYADENPGVPVQDIWLGFKDAHNQNVRISGYPTEKNLDLLKRIIQTSSNPGDLVLDSFSGSGTTLIAADDLGRRWIGMDNSPLARLVMLDRLLEPQSADMGDAMRRLTLPLIETEARHENLRLLEQTTQYRPRNRSFEFWSSHRWSQDTERSGVQITLELSPMPAIKLEQEHGTSRPLGLLLVGRLSQSGAGEGEVLKVSKSVLLGGGREACVVTGFGAESTVEGSSLAALLFANDGRVWLERLDS